MGETTSPRKPSGADAPGGARPGRIGERPQADPGGDAEQFRDDARRQREQSDDALDNQREGFDGHGTAR